MAKKKKTPKSETKRLDLGAIPSSLPSEPIYTFGDISKENNNPNVNEEKILDEKLKELNLVRKKIPKDGACMFRAVADQVYYSQAMHLLVRHRCVEFMSKHRSDFEPFVCISGMPFDHYLFEMRKKNSWGGQAEIQALSLVYRVNFTIYSTAKEPTKLENGFPKTVTMCYYDNHYDSVISAKEFEEEKFCQSIIYSLVDRALKVDRKVSDITYKNIGWEWWLRDLKAQQEHDELLAKQMADNEEGDYKALTGYHKKSNPEEEWRVSTNRKAKLAAKQVKYQIKPGNTPNTKKNQDDLSEALLQIAMMEERERRIKEKDPTEFPVLATKPKEGTPIGKPAPKTAPEAVPTSPATSEKQEGAPPTEGATPTATPEKKAWGKSVNWGKHLHEPRKPPAPAPQTPQPNGEAKPNEGAQPEPTQVSPKVEPKSEEAVPPTPKVENAPTSPAVATPPIQEPVQTPEPKAEQKPAPVSSPAQPSVPVQLPEHILKNLALEDDIAFGDFGASKKSSTPKVSSPPVPQNGNMGVPPAQPVSPPVTSPNTAHRTTSPPQNPHFPPQYPAPYYPVYYPTGPVPVPYVIPPEYGYPHPYYYPVPQGMMYVQPTPTSPPNPANNNTRSLPKNQTQKKQ